MNGEIITSNHETLSEAEAWIDARLDEKIDAQVDDGPMLFHFEHDGELKSFELVFNEPHLPSYQATYDIDDC